MSIWPSGKGKRWKNLYFILEGNDAQLIYFESEKRATKPKGLIDLSVCSVYGVHDSLFGRWDIRILFVGVGSSVTQFWILKTPHGENSFIEVLLGSN